MKHLLTSVLFVSLTVLAFGQVTLEQTYPTGATSYGDNLRFVRLHSGMKYYKVDTTSRTLTVYHLNHSIYRNITIPAFSITSVNWLVSFVSEKLFDTDSTDIDYGVVAITNSQPFYSNLYIFNESGTIIFSHDTAQFGGGSNGYSPISIFNSDSGTKMILTAGRISPPVSKWAKVYSLPGTLPCGNCGSPYGPMVSDGEEGNHNYFLEYPFPNPTSSTTTVPYRLPPNERTGELVFFDLSGKLVKRFMVDDTFKELVISTTDLSPGTYYYQLQTNGISTDGRKLIVVK
jgi:hypothetical protein